ncbi:unnamed protein product [Lymnaea stagnalis]|uniref:MACPF domain-containing protein n=1 Tax=Lymnaea stagnalis TaxID=6523 RepID=A0AAV2GY26_LYMST
MVRGVDITKLDLTPSKPGLDGFKSPVVTFTCGDGNTWRGGQGEDEYQLPDQVWQITSLPGGWLSAETDIYKSYNEIREKMTQDVGGEGLIWKFAFSASHSYTTMQNTITNNSKYISEVSAFESATNVEFDPSWVLEMDTFAKIFIDRKISGTFEKNQSAYFTFINQFGTHYFSSANFGGFVREVLETKKEFFSSKTDSDVENNAKASFLNIISLHGGKVSSSTKVDETFSTATTYFAQYFGGDRNLLVQDGIQKWQPTVDKDPWLFSGKLTQISELIENEDKRSSMEKAVDNYVLRSYLNELDRLITTAKAKSGDSTITALQQSVSDLKNRTLLDINEVNDLGKTVEGIFLVPDWFTSNTKLCFK